MNQNWSGRSDCHATNIKLHCVMDLRVGEDLYIQTSTLLWFFMPGWAMLQHYNPIVVFIVCNDFLCRMMRTKKRRMKTVCTPRLTSSHSTKPTLICSRSVSDTCIIQWSCHLSVFVLVAVFSYIIGFLAVAWNGPFHAFWSIISYISDYCDMSMYHITDIEGWEMMGNKLCWSIY